MTTKGNGSSEPPRSKLEDEVLEILMKNDRPPSNVVKFQARVNQTRYTWPQRIRAKISANRLSTTHLLVAAVALAVIGFIVSDASPFAGRLLVFASLGALIAMFVRYFKGPQRAQTKKWRGRDIDMTRPDTPDWLKRDRGPRR